MNKSYNINPIIFGRSTQFTITNGMSKTILSNMFEILHSNLMTAYENGDDKEIERIESEQGYIQTIYNQ